MWFQEMLESLIFGKSYDSELTWLGMGGPFEMAVPGADKTAICTGAT